MTDAVYLGWKISKDDKPRPYHYAKKRFEAGFKSKSNLNNAVSFHGEGHLITIAPTGSGKGVASIVPNLLSYSESVIVIDPKGENFKITAKRRLELGHNVYVLDPFKVVTNEPYVVKYEFEGHVKTKIFSGDSLDPLEIMFLGKERSDSEAYAIAKSLAERSGNNALWDNTATSLLAGIIQFVATSSRFAEDASLSSVIKVANSPVLINDMRIYSKDLDIDSYSKTIFEQFVEGNDQKFQSEVLDFVRSYLSTFSTKDIQPSISKSTIDMKKLSRGERSTVYIIFPSSQIQSYGRLLRMWVTVFIRSILHRGPQSKIRTLFMLDECANLGPLEQLRIAVTLLRGYGLRVWMFFQDLSQVKTLYPDWLNMINNCEVVQAFGMGRFLTSAPIAEILGEVDKEMISRLGKNQQIISVSHKKPLVAELMKYYEDKAFIGKWTPINSSSEGDLG